MKTLIVALWVLECVIAVPFLVLGFLFWCAKSGFVSGYKFAEFVFEAIGKVR